jgi:hypothetical protein
MCANRAFLAEGGRAYLYRPALSRLRSSWHMAALDAIQSNLLEALPTPANKHRYVRSRIGLSTEFRDSPVIRSALFHRCLRVFFVPINQLAAGKRQPPSSAFVLMTLSTRCVAYQLHGHVLLLFCFIAARRLHEPGATICGRFHRHTQSASRRSRSRDDKGRRFPLDWNH